MRRKISGLFFLTAFARAQVSFSGRFRGVFLFLLFISHFSFFSPKESFGQNPLVKQWDYRFGGSGTEELKSFQQTTDGGYILGGFSDSDSSGDRTQENWDTALVTSDYWIVKIDSTGNKLWDKRFGGSNEDELLSLQQTNDRGYILGGFSHSGISGDKTQAAQGYYDYWLVKIDSFGNKQWDKRFGGSKDQTLVVIHRQKMEDIL